MVNFSSPTKNIVYILLICQVEIDPFMMFLLVLLYVTIFLVSLLVLFIAFRNKRHDEPFVLQSHPSPSAPPPRTYDVFLSFRGEDSRNRIVGHLYKALDRYGIYTFKDDEKINKGKTVTPELLKSIEESRFSIAILSENYATSTYCLDELVKIIECVDQFGQIVVPIFYNIDPSNIRKQTGSFKRAFDEHEKTFKKDKNKVLKWREALRRVGSISGSDSRNKDESKLIEEIVREISDKLFSESSNDDSKLVGMSYHMEKMKSLLWRDDPNEVLMVGISGMGGIGKTTLSRALYNRYSRLYDGRCYVGNVKDIFRKHDRSSLQEKLLSEIFLDRNLKVHTLNDNINVIKERLSRKKIFIVLDDIDDVEQLETLADKHDWFGPGSRIIMTTRDNGLLNSHRVNFVYEVRGLAENEAIQLFSQYAFKQGIPTSDYLELSYQFVSYAKGLPLALKVLGSFLHMKTIDEWASELNKFRRIPNPTIQRVLKISFDGLNDEQKDIFLDIACFFKWDDKDFVTDILESCGFFPESELQVLEDKSLITISDNKLLVHDLLQGMGWEVVRKESKERGARSRLWLTEDVYHVLKHNTGTKAVESIFLDISKIEELHVPREAFQKMYNLRLLKIYHSGHTLGLKESIKVHFPQGLEGLSDELRYLHWHGYPLEYLPCNFQPANLVELNMSDSNLEQIYWGGTKIMEKFKRLELSHSRKLQGIGDLSLAKNLEVINLEGCISLLEIHSSIRYLNVLTVLNLRNCKNLKSLPQLPTNIKHLLLDSTSINDLQHSSFLYSTQLVTISLKDCKFLSNLPHCFSGLNSLKHLILSGCSIITELPDSFEHLSSLVSLEAERIGIDRLPSSVSDLRSLETLLLSGCKGKDSTGLSLPRLGGLHSLKSLKLSDCNIVEIPEGLASLTCLQKLDLSRNNFERIDVSLEPLSNLSDLTLNECKKLRLISKLPANIKRLQTHNCESLENVSTSLWKRDDPKVSSKSIPVFESSKLVFTNCFNLNPSTLKNLMTDVEERLQVDAEATKKLFKPWLGGNFNVALCYPGREIPNWFTHQSEGSSLTLELQPERNSSLVGFTVCVVVAFNGCCHDNDFKLKCDFSLATNFDSSLDNHYQSFELGLWFEEKTNINSSHVLIGYDISLLGFIRQDIYINSQMVFNTGYFSNGGSYWNPFRCCKVKKCGVLPIYIEKHGQKKKKQEKEKQQPSLLLSSPSSMPIRTSHVFLSFRDTDTRRHFASHLNSALCHAGMRTFHDDIFVKGKNDEVRLLNVIEKSRFSIVILSKNYATSRWCLDELVKIIQCMDQLGQIVVPVFYDVDPLDVREQSGRFKRDFDKHEKTVNKERVDQWREAFRKVGSINGPVCDNRVEAEIVNEIVRDITNRQFIESSKYGCKLVGMSYHIQQLSSLLCSDSSDEVLMIEIWGMEGIGKTTISRVFYNMSFLDEYDGRCYVENVKDIFRKHGSSFLREKLLSEIFLDRIHSPNENSNVIKERLYRKKVFIVLDDVDDIEQLVNLSDKHDWFGPGSRIVITTRNQHLLISHGVNYLYNACNLTDTQAFRLFNHYAFKQDTPPSDYLKLSNQFVSFAKGLPLAIEVLGSFLYRKSIDEWHVELNKLRKIPDATIQDVLRISFDGLDDIQKKLFLDIACFSKWEDKDFVDFETELRVLEKKSLITISYNKLVLVHDLLKEMGCQKSSKEPGDPSRLCISGDSSHICEHNKGKTIAVDGIPSGISKMEEMQLKCEAFKKMNDVRLLKIYGSDRTPVFN